MAQAQSEGNDAQFAQALEHINQIRESKAAKKRERKQLIETKVFLLDGCSHLFHGDCLRKYFTGEIKENKFPLRCPVPKCRTQASIGDLKSLLPETTLDLYYERTFNSHAEVQKDISWCPTADCSYAFVFQEGDD